MKVALDLQLAVGTATGIGEYARGLAAALRANGVDVCELSDPRFDPWRFDRRVLWDQLLLPRAARACGARLLHCTSGTMPVRAALPIVVTVHDVAWLRVQHHTRSYARWYFGAFAARRYRRAQAVLVDSAFSRSELLEVLPIRPDRVHVVYPGVAADFCSLERREPSERIVLLPGTLEPRKNAAVLIRALALLDGVRLICAGPFTPYREECERIARELGVFDRVEFRGYVSREELLRLYATCSLVAVPSIYEGFGYAAAQALCSATPLIVSNRASLPEVVQDAAPLIDATGERAWAAAIDAILNSPEEAQAHASARRRSAAERFSWDAAALATIAVYERVLHTIG